MIYENILPQDAPSGFLRWKVGDIQCDVGLYKPEPPAALSWYENTTEDQRNDTWEYTISNGDQIIASDWAIEGIDVAIEQARIAFESAIRESEAGMKRYEYKAFVIAEAETEHEAVKKILEMTDAINKNPDGPRVYLDDGPPYVEETGE